MNSVTSLGARRVSFRVATTGVMTLAVLICCISMFIPLETFTRTISSETVEACRGSVIEQRGLITNLVYQNVTHAKYKQLLHAIRTMVVQYVRDPPTQAIDAMWSAMQMWHAFNASWEGDDSMGREMINYRCWVELSTQWNTKGGLVQELGPYKVADWRNPHADWLYVTWESEAFAGVHFDHDMLYNEYTPVVIMSDAPGGGPGVASTLTSWEMDPTTGEKVGNASTFKNYLPTARPFYRIQSSLRDWAEDHFGGAGNLKAIKAWSELYPFVLDKGVGLTWTAPVAYCGNYSCLQGVLSSDVTLKYVSVYCYEQWKGLAKSLASTFPINSSISSVFLVNSLSQRFPLQQGLLVGAAHQPEAMPNFDLTKASDSPQDVVNCTAQALLLLFGAWDNPELLDGEQLLTFRPSRIRQEVPVVESCEPTAAAVGPSDDCLQVGTTPIRMDEFTTWLVVAVIPLGAFSLEAVHLAQNTDRHVRTINHEAKENLEQARWLGIAVLFVMMVLGVGLGFCVGFLVTRPLRRLGKLMRRLGDLDFAHETAEFEELRSGRRSRIREVGKLQDSFCHLSSGIEAFARFVPELVVRNIVRGDRQMTRLHVCPRFVTTMFADIVGSTSISETLSQRDLLFLLTRYFSVMTRIIESYEGVVAEFLGDGLLVFWNAPDDCEEHAAKACSSALAQQLGVSLVNTELELLGLPQLGVRIGVHSGHALSGNIGSDVKMKFGCLGDSVDFAGCLEGLCKNYGVGIICSGATFAALPSSTRFVCRRLDLVKVKATAEPTSIYEVIGRDPLGPSESVRHGASRGTASPKDDAADLECGFTPPPAAAAISAVHGSAEALRSQAAVSGLFAEPMRWLSRPRQARPRRRGRLETTSTLCTPTAATPRTHQTPRTPASCRTQPSAAATALAAVRSAASKHDVRYPARMQLSEEVEPGRRRRAEMYEQALAAFQEARFEEAGEVLRAIREQDPDDAAAARLLERVLLHRGPDGSVVGLSEEQLLQWTGVQCLAD